MVWPVRDIYGINTTRDISKLYQISLASRLTASEIMYNNFEISLVIFAANITANHANYLYKFYTA